MRYPYQILFPLLSLFFCRVDLTDLIPLQLEVEVIEILDGDTVVVRTSGTSWRVRLSKVDAPELGQPFFSGGDAGLLSKACLSQILVKKRQLLMVEGVDVYHRVLGDVGGANAKLIERGCASLYPYARFRSRAEKGRYLRSLFQAKRKRIGLWARGGYRQPRLWRKASKRSAARR